MGNSTTDGDSVTDAKGTAVAEIARAFFGVQLHYAGVLSARAGMPLGEAITFHTNFHRLFAYGNLGKMKPDPAFLALVRDVVTLERKRGLIVSLRPMRSGPPIHGHRIAFRSAITLPARRRTMRGSCASIFAIASTMMHMGRFMRRTLGGGATT